MMLIAPAAQAALPVCSATAGITVCCRITKPGDYTVMNDLSDNAGTCIKLASPGVMLNGNGDNLSGNNGTGIGIQLLPTAAGDLVEGFNTVSNFRIGIRDDAPRSAIFSNGITTVVGDNSGNGIVIRANQVSLIETESNSNDGNGVVVKPLAPASVVSNVFFHYVSASSNTKAGFLLDSLGTSSALASYTSYNGTDGVDLINSVNSTIVGGISTSNLLGDGVKLVGGDGDIVSQEGISYNAIGLKVRNSTFDTFSGDSISFNTGDGMLIVNGSGENILATSASSNGGSGIHLRRTTSSNVLGPLRVASDNQGAGIWLDGSRHVNVEESASQFNVKSNVYIGCSSAQEPDGTTCASMGLPASNGNTIIFGTFDYVAGYPKPDVGVGIDRGNHHNDVLENTATGNSTDLMDKTKNCDSNEWMANNFDTTSPAQLSCIQ